VSQVTSSQRRYHSIFFFFSSRRRHTRLVSDWSSDVCSSDLDDVLVVRPDPGLRAGAGADHGKRGDIIGRQDEWSVDVAVQPEARSEERRVGKECRARWAAEK